MAKTRRFANTGIPASKLRAISAYINAKNSRSLGNDWGHHLWGYCLFYDDEWVPCAGLSQVEALIKQRGDTTKHITYFESRTGRILRIDATDTEIVRVEIENGKFTDTMHRRVAELLGLGQPLPERNEEDILLAINQMTRGHLSPSDVLPIARQAPDYAVQVIDAIIEDRFHSIIAERQRHALLEVLFALLGPDCFYHQYRDFARMSTSVLHFLEGNIHSFSRSTLIKMKAQFSATPLGSRAEERLTDYLRIRSKNLAGGQFGLREDVEELQANILDLSLTQDLSELITKVQRALDVPQDDFDYAAQMKHLRALFERLHKDIGGRIRNVTVASQDNTDLSRCGHAIDYLQRHDVITKEFQALGRALYSVLSNSGVHALKSSREYTRLCWNMVVEYATVLVAEHKLWANANNTVMLSS